MVQMTQSKRNARSKDSNDANNRRITKSLERRSGAAHIVALIEDNTTALGLSKKEIAASRAMLCFAKFYSYYILALFMSF